MNTGAPYDTLWAWCLLAWGLAWLGVRGLIGYAHRQGMLDLPGQRRSHRLPTPRGGGLGMVVAILVAVAGWSLTSTLSAQARTVLLAAAIALLMVAGVGWWDDRRSLPAWPRLLVQLIACGGFALVMCDREHIAQGWVLPLCVAGTASINLHNFMDGIDGLLAMHAIFVAVVLAVMGWAMGVATLTALAAITAAAVLGFLAYNRPPARIFMGDVGSGSLGLLVFILLALVWAKHAEYVCSALIACSGFMIDAGFTLVWRMFRGRRWFSPHREHLYQWLVRRGWSHARTGCLYMIWNLMSLPAVLAAWHLPKAGWAWMLAWYALGGSLWWMGRMRCLRQARSLG